MSFRPLLIHSPNNELFRQLKSLKSTRAIRELNLCAIHGLRFAEDLGQRKRIKINYIVLTDEMKPGLPPSLTENQQAKLVELSSALYRELDEFGTREPIVYCQLPSIPRLGLGEESLQRSILLPFQNPENLGAAIRSAAAFGVRVLLSDESAFAFHPKAIRASAGAVFDCELAMIGRLGDFQPDKENSLVLDAAGIDIAGVEVPPNFLLIPGIEGPGIPSSVSGFQRICIPMQGPIESLNASVAAGIALYALTQKLKS